MASLVVLVGLSFYLFGDAGIAGPIQGALVFATMIAVFIAWRRGHGLESLRQAAVERVGSGVGAIFIHGDGDCRVWEDAPHTPAVASGQRVTRTVPP